jgi:hypothetical protein
MKSGLLYVSFQFRMFRNGVCLTSGKGRMTTGIPTMFGKGGLL